MRGFRASKSGGASGSLTPNEAELLRTFASQLAILVESTPAELDPAIERLLPDAYRDDHEEAAEFRRLTEPDLRSRKKSNAETIVATLDAGETRGKSSDIRFTVDAIEAVAWLRALADLRLVLATRLGIDDVDVVGSDEPTTRGAYDWLAWLQDSLVRAMSKAL